MGNRLEQHFTKKYIQVANKHVKCCSISNEISMQYHYIYNRKIKMIKTNKPKYRSYNSLENCLAGNWTFSYTMTQQFHS